MSKYKRKTVDVFEIEGYYAHGWECVTLETSHKEARARLKEYRDNEPNAVFRLVIKREKIVKTIQEVTNA